MGGIFRGEGGSRPPRPPKPDPPNFAIFRKFSEIFGKFWDFSEIGDFGTDPPEIPIFGISGDDLGVGVTTQSRGKSPLLRAKRGAPGCNDKGCGIKFFTKNYVKVNKEN